MFLCQIWKKNKLHIITGKADGNIRKQDEGKDGKDEREEKEG